MTRLATAFIATLALAAPASAACSISDITIKQADWRVSDLDETTVYAFGEIINNCAEAIGVELESVWRDADGKVIDYKNYWPASIRNIDGNGGSQAFRIHMRIPPGVTVKNVTTRVISVSKWRAR